VVPQIPLPPASSSASARVIDLNPEFSAILLIWWVAVHALVIAAIVVLGAPWVPKALALLIALVHAIALAPERTPRVIYRSGGRVAVPELGLDELTLGPRTRYTTGWIRFDLRGGGRALDILLLADQVEPAIWRALQAELRRIRPAVGNEAAAK
jgi:hypothetical protein